MYTSLFCYVLMLQLPKESIMNYRTFQYTVLETIPVAERYERWSYTRENACSNAVRSSMVGLHGRIYPS